MFSSTTILRASVAKTSKPAFSFSLEHFVLRAKILALYRQFVRASRPMGDLKTRVESLAFFRSDFDRLAQVQDTERLKQFLVEGQRTLKQLRNTGILIGEDGPKLRGLRGYSQNS